LMAGRFMNDDWHKAIGKYLNTNDPEEIKKTLVQKKKR